MEFGILGHLRVFDGGQELSIPAKLRTLLAVLLVHRGNVVSAGQLADELWGDHRADRSLDTVRAHVRDLRALFDAGLRLVTLRGAGYRLEVAPDQVDADRFVELAHRGIDLVARQEHERGAAVLSEGLRLWRGPPLPELSDSPAALDVVGRLEQLRQRARIAQVTAEVALGRTQDVAAELGQLVHESPTHERLRYWWALATYHTAGVTKAARACQEGIAYLAAHGVEVDELRDLQQRILRQDPALDPKAPRRRSESLFDIEHVPSPTFIGRLDQLSEISALLAVRRGLSAPGTVAIHGLGGVGKTRLAIEYCYLHADEYDVVYWIAANDKASVLVGLGALAHRLGVPDSVPQDVIVARTWDALRDRGRWLLVYDDAGAPADLEPYWPRASDGHVLVTSRNPAWGGRATPYLLRPLTLTAAVDFFLRHETDDDRAAATELSTALGGLPLAMELARAYMEETSTTAQDYLLRLREHTATVLGTADADTSRSVAGTWLMALDSLRGQEIEAEQLLCLFAFLGPAAFSRSYLVKHRDRLPDGLRAALGHAPARDRVMAALSRLSLATVSPATIEVHVLLQAVIDLLLPADQRDSWLRAAIDLVSAGIPTDTQGATASSEFAPLYPHAQAVVGRPRCAHIDPAGTARLATAAARHALVLGDLPAAIESYRRALALLDDLDQGGVAATADLLMELGLAQRDSGDYGAATAVFTRACRIREGLFGAQSVEVSDALTMIGLVLFDTGDMTAALASLDTAAAIQRSLPDVGTRVLARTSGTRGLVLWRMYRLPEAREALTRAAVLLAELLGPDQPGVASALDNLGKVALDQGDLAQALSLNERALRIRVTRLGAGHWHTAISLNHLGHVLRELGRLDDALTSHERALAVFQDWRDMPRSHVARSLAGVGQVLIEQQQYVTAADRLRAAQTVFVETVGAEHYETATCLGQLADAIAGCGDIAGARAMTERALTLLAQSKAYPHDHPEIERLRARLNGSPAG
jgi:DNA-binding SARP family transcriptional activator/tetratricopeptide (TPR) repeat protein